MKFRSLRSKTILYSSLCLLLLGAAIIAYTTIYVRNLALRRANDQIRYIAQDRAEHVRDELNKGMTSLHTLALLMHKTKDPLDTMIFEREQVDTLLQSILKQNKEFIGAYTSWLPNAFDNKDKYYANEPGHGKTGRFATYWYRNNHGIIDVEPCKHHHEEGADYLIDHKRIKQPLVTDPHIHKVGGKDLMIVSLMMPVIFKEQYHGIVGVDLKTDALQRLTDEIGGNKKGSRVIILTSSGKIAGLTDRPELIGEDASKTQGHFRQVDKEIARGAAFEASSRAYVKFFSPVKITNSRPWWVMVSVPRIMATAEAWNLTRHLMFVGVACIIISILFFWLFSNGIVSPLSSLVRGIKQVGRGNYGRIIENISSQDEIGELAAEFNKMSIEVKNKDIAREKAQKSLVETNVLLETILSHTHVSVAYLDPQFNFLKVNRAYAEADDKDPTFFHGKNHFDLYPNADNEKIFLRVVETGEPYYAFAKSFEYAENPDRGVSYWDWSLVPVQNPSGNQSGLLLTLANVTERIKTEKELRESDMKYRAMMEAMEDPVSICSPDHRVEYMNPAMIKRTGRDAKGERCFKALHDLDEKCPWCLHHKTQNGEHFTTDIVSPKDNRSYVVSHSPIFHEDGSISKMTIFRDTTDFKKMESQLQQAQKMESIGTLAGGIAHDFNNILSPIMIHSEMAMMDLPPDSSIQFNLKEIFQAGERARDMVKQILAFSRKSEQEHIPVNLSLIVKNTLKLLRYSLPSTIEIKQNIEVKSNAVLADPTQINQVVMNLATNAAHAMRAEGGVLEVSLVDQHIDEAALGRLSDLNPGSYLKLTVSDSGHGIAPEVRERMFEPYFTTKKIGEGTGMGLAVTHGIVKSHGGDITCESEAGRGTTFHVLLPLIESEASSVTERETYLPRGKERLLFVDDEKVAVDAIQPMLEILGYNVTARTSSIEALEAFRNNPDAFDLVITDQTMPNMTGKDLAKKLMTIRSDIAIILCTGFSEQIDEKRAKVMGISAFVMKPIIMHEMATTIRQVLDKK